MQLSQGMEFSSSKPPQIAGSQLLDRRFGMQRSNTVTTGNVSLFSSITRHCNQVSKYTTRCSADQCSCFWFKQFRALPFLDHAPQVVLSGRRNQWRNMMNPVEVVSDLYTHTIQDGNRRC